jgi:hypothetical protein
MAIRVIKSLDSLELLLNMIPKFAMSVENQVEEFRKLHNYYLDSLKITRVTIDERYANAYESISAELYANEDDEEQLIVKMNELRQRYNRICTRIDEISDVVNISSQQSNYELKLSMLIQQSDQFKSGLSVLVKSANQYIHE